MNLGYPLAYFITWTTYGSWLPGDARGWVDKVSKIVQQPDPYLESAARQAMTEEDVVLSRQQRDLVDGIIVRHCQIRTWQLHARNARTNHIHVVVTAALDGDEVR